MIDERRAMLQQAAGWSAIIGPITFVVIVLVLPWGHDSYSHVVDQLSELGARQAPNAIFFNWLGMGLLGSCNILLALGLHLTLRPSYFGWLGPALLAIGGGVQIAIGALPCDSGCQNYTRVGELHEVVAIGLFTLALAPLAIAPRLWSDAGWKNLAGFSVGMGFLSLVAGALFGFGPNLGSLDLTGVFQRLAVLGGLIWDVVMGRRLLSVVSERALVNYGQSA